MRKVALAAILIALVAGVLFFRSKKKERSGEKARILAERAYRKMQQENPDIRPTPEIVLKESDLYVFGGNHIQACRVQAQESRVHRNSQITQCRQVICTLTTNKNWVTTLQAPQATIDHNKGCLYLQGNVVSTLEKRGNL